MTTIKPIDGNETLGWAWVSLCAALAAHIADESLTDFLSIYNPTVLAIRRNLPSFPMPTFEFNSWLAGLITADAALLCLAPLMFRDTRWIRPAAYLFSGLMLVNGLGHIVGTIAGRTVASVRFARPMPGFWSSPVLIAASLYLLHQLWNSRKQQERLSWAERP